MLPLYDPAQDFPPSPQLATLTVTPKGVLHLHASLRELLGLRYGQSINLRPPEFGSPFWHLDLRPHAEQQVYWHGNKMRAKNIRLPPGLVLANLTLYLVPGAPLYPHYYPLVASHALAAQ